MANDFLIAVVFPDYLVGFLKKRWPYLGHAGIVLIDGANGKALYYEYGRYDKKDMGITRLRVTSEVKIVNGKPTPDSVLKLLKKLSEVSGDGTAAIGAQAAMKGGAQGGFKLGNDFVANRIKENKNKNRRKYQPFTHNCAHFVEDVLVFLNKNAEAPKPPLMLDPRPRSYIHELRSQTGYEPVPNP